MNEKIFCSVEVLSFKENIFIFNQSVFEMQNFLFPSGFFHVKIHLFSIKEKSSIKLFYPMIFGNHIWSSIC